MSTSDKITLSLSLSTPHSVGEFETGCQTFEGNNIILYYQNTPRLIELSEYAFTVSYKYMLSKRFAESDSSFRSALQNAKIGTGIIFAGVWVLNDAHQVIAAHFKYFWKELLRMYQQEIGPLDFDIKEEDVRRDVINWMFRKYEYWVVKHHHKYAY